MSSPTQRSKKQMEDRGYLVAIVEYWHAFAHQRRDLFGAFDLLGVGDEGTLAVQTTSAANVSSRVKKLSDLETVAAVRKAGWRIEVHGWRKAKSGWVCRVVDMSQGA